MANEIAASVSDDSGRHILMAGGSVMEAKMDDKKKEAEQDKSYGHEAATLFLFNIQQSASTRNDNI